MLELISDASIAIITALVRLHRRLWERDHATHPKPCIACAYQSRNHPAGQLTRYTTTRVAGHPICERHSPTDLSHLLEDQ